MKKYIILMALLILIYSCTKKNVNEWSPFSKMEILKMDSMINDQGLSDWFNSMLKVLNPDSVSVKRYENLHFSGIILLSKYNISIKEDYKSYRSKEARILFQVFNYFLKRKLDQGWNIYQKVYWTGPCTTAYWGAVERCDRNLVAYTGFNLVNLALRGFGSWAIGQTWTHIQHSFCIDDAKNALHACVSERYGGFMGILRPGDTIPNVFDPNSPLNKL